MLRSRMGLLLQPFNTYTNAAMVQNTWYTAMTATKPGNIIMATLMQTNGAAAAMDMEVRWTIDGDVVTGSASCASGTYYYISWYPLDLLTISTDLYSPIQYEGQMFQTLIMEVRTTSVIGAGFTTNQFTWYQYMIPNSYQ